MDAATYTLVEAAQLLGIGRSTAYEVAARGDFPVPVIKVGRCKRVSRRLLDELIDPSPADLPAAEVAGAVKR